MCEDSDRARSTEFIQHVPADRRSMLGAYIHEKRTYGSTDASIGGGLAGAMDDGLHAGAGGGMGNSNTSSEFCDQGIDTQGPFISRRTFGELGGQFYTRDDLAGWVGHRGGVTLWRFNGM